MAATARLRIAAALLGVMLVAGCATRPRAPAPAPSPAPSPPATAAVATPAAYVAAAGSASLSLLRASDMAGERARQPALRDLAARIAADHRGISGQLSFAGRRLDLLMPAVPSPRDGARLDALAASADFDAAYRTYLRALLAEQAALHADVAARGTSPTLRPVAAMAAPILRAELAAVPAR